MIRYSEEEKETHLALWRESGLSKRAYSHASGLSYRTFLRWSKATHAKGVMPQAKETERFISVSMPDSVSTGLQEFIEVCYPDGIMVKLPITTSMSVLKELLS